MPRALQANKQAVRPRAPRAVLLLPCSASQMPCQGGAAMGTPPEQALRIKQRRYQCGCWPDLAMSSWLLCIPLHGWCRPQPCTSGMAYGQESRWGRTDRRHRASAVGKVLVSLLFLTVGKSLLHVSQHCPAPPEHVCARRRYRSSPVAGRETEAGSTPQRLPQERLGKSVSMEHLVPLPRTVLAWH